METIPMDQKRILILYADAGFGHRSAALAIKDALSEKYGAFCTIDMVNALDDERTPAVLRDSQSDYDKLIRNTPELYKIGYEASDSSFPSSLMESALVLMLYDVMRDLVKRYQPDVIVSTYPLYQSPLDALFTIDKASIPIIEVVTDLVSVHRLWFNRGVDLCLVPTPAVHDLAVQCGVPPEKVVLNGIPISPEISREKRSKLELRKDLDLDPDRFTLLVAGSKRLEGVPEILTGLNHSGLPIQMILVAGGDQDQFEQYQKETWHIPVKTYNFIDFMPTLMHASDAILCKAGGLIVSESLACGLPMLLMNVLPGQEAGNAEYVLQNQAGEMVKDPISLLETCAHWLMNDAELLRSTAANACQIGHPNAAYKAAEQIWIAVNSEGAQRSVTHLFERAKLIRSLKRYRKELSVWVSDQSF
jgi:1,2-diacylglycerol 3-beta-galactosyltransferase